MPKKQLVKAKGDFKTSRNVIFTLNNYTPDEIVAIQKAVVTRMVYQPEKGAEGTLHLQGYAETKGAISKSAWKKLLGTDRLHLEKRLGTIKQAYDYCTKEDSRTGAPFIVGDFSKDVKRVQKTTLDSVIDMLKAGKTIKDVFDFSPAYFVKNKKYILDASNMLLKGQTKFKPRVVVVITGKSGVGKTRYFHEKFPLDCWKLTKPSGNNNLWFDDYMGEANVLIDEFTGWMPINTLQGLLDGYPMQVEVKGGHTYFNPRLIYITSNKPFDNWYKWEEHGPDIKESVLRRINLIVACPETVPYDTVKREMDRLIDDLIKQDPYKYKTKEFFMYKTGAEEIIPDPDEITIINNTKIPNF